MNDPYKNHDKTAVKVKKKVKKKKVKKIRRKQEKMRKLFYSKTT